VSPANPQERPGNAFPVVGRTVAENSSGEPQIDSQSFLIRIWREAGGTAGRNFWRGHITRIGSEERKYVQSFEELAEYIGQFLPAMGVRLSWRWRTRLWLQRHKKHWWSGK
jgi:hypothetical protein